MTHTDRLRAIAEQHRFTLAMALVVGVACVMTAISLSLYASSGTLQLDLSRPGYEAARKDIINPDDTSKFSPSGPINADVLSQYQKLFDAQRKEMNTIGKFKDKGLDDATLGLSVPAESTETTQ